MLAWHDWRERKRREDIVKRMLFRDDMANARAAARYGLHRRAELQRRLERERTA